MQDNSTSSSSSQVSTPNVEPENNNASKATVVEKVTVVETKKGGGGKCLLVGCVVLILCCIVTFGGIYALFKFGGAAIVSSQTEPDPTLNRLESIDQVEIEYDSLDIKSEFLPENPSVEMTSIELTEEQLLAILFKNFNVKDNLNSFGVDLEPDRIKLEANLGALYANFEPSDQASSYQGLDEMYASVDISVLASGNEFKVNQVSLGNSLLDSVLGGSIAEYLEKLLNENIVGNVEENISIEKIDILKDKLILLVSTNSPMTTDVNEDGEEMNNYFNFEIK